MSNTTVSLLIAENDLNEQNYLLVDVKYSVSLGIFPTIKRAYLSVDHRLFLWNYNDGSVKENGFEKHNNV